ncbi:hypothetical protein [Paraflavitalea pollutisoli]|uniref:hypothetical protein n=1 Tax=Paraflavitalea pollutisoli TaxID=3034143 RepID=UPI0023EB0997|nr:hypothetical protein [Paraflavitalea sp. H1-2-19X]
MNQYLLLRDNKQTGPYSVEELIKKGLKPYDLVWLDGKSAAWRYPSEIAELKAFAPTVEEQPYDRFYKKQNALKATAANNTQQQTSKTEEPAPVAAIPTQQVIANKKIYVTLPAGMTSRIPSTPAVTTEQPVQTAEEAVTEAQVAAAKKVLDEKFARLREEKMRQAAISAANTDTYPPTSTGNKKTIQQDPITPTAEAAEPIVETPGFAVILGQNHPHTDDQLAPVINIRRDNSKLVMRSITAACLLLVGVIIGLMISNSRQQRDNTALDQLVKQIQERDRQKREVAQYAVTTTGEAIAQPITDEAVPAEPPAQNESARVSPKTTPATETHSLEAPVVKENVPVKDVSQRQTVKVIPAMVAARTNETPPSGHDVQKARESIHQQVAVDANKYKIGVLGGISDLQLTLSNNSGYPLDQVEVALRYLGPEKRVVKTQMLLFNDLAPGEQKTVEAPRTNRGVSVDYVITRINSKALGLAHAGY